MELRVEGKVCKTGRTHNNNNNNIKIIPPVSAPPYVSLSKDLPGDSESDHPHSANILNNLDNTLSSNNDELNQTLTDHNDTISSNSTLDKIDDCRHRYQRNNKSNQISTSSHGKRHKRSTKTNSNRITVDTLPIDRFSRSKINDRIPTGKYIYFI
jgi:hypothetical protein